ncbi:MAG TPA: ABC transporter ATP-binding protein, partial [Candidatus Sulfotelmatobacter sp.]|nr:ABC transporter ATP-binding protein [Candidatus Sulfotelmatobacter sp.]
MSGTEAYFCGEQISLHFGGIAALRDAWFAVPRGSLQAVIGPNGAGKTSLFNIITGFYPMDTGDIRLEGRSLARLPSHQIAEAGIVRTFQNLELFTNMTVLENVLTGGHLQTRYGGLDLFVRTRRFHKEERGLRVQAEAALEFVGLTDRRHQSAGELPLGSARLLEIARALCAAPRVLLLDEPGAGLNLREKVDLGRLIRRVVERGITVVMVEHDMELVMGISDRVLVLNQGEVIASGTPAEVQRDPGV